MKVSELADRLGFRILNDMHDIELSGIFISDVVSVIVEGLAPTNLLVTVQTHKNLIASANLVEAGAVLFVRGRIPDEETVELANRAKLTLMTTEPDTWNTAVKLYEAGMR